MERRYDRGIADHECFREDKKTGSLLNSRWIKNQNKCLKFWASCAIGKAFVHIDMIWTTQERATIFHSLQNGNFDRYHKDLMKNNLQDCGLEWKHGTCRIGP